MHQDSLNELEAAMLKKRLKFLRAQGATGKQTYRLGDDFFKQMETTGRSVQLSLTFML